MKYYATVDDEEFVIEVRKGQILVNGELLEMDFQQMPGSGVTSLLINNRSLEAVVEEQEEGWQVLIQGELYQVTVDDERSRRLASARGILGHEDGEAAIKSPMPGIIISVPVSEGDRVHKGDKVVILESMKMENELRAPRDGQVSHIKVQAGDTVEKNQVLLTISD